MDTEVERRLHMEKMFNELHLVADRIAAFDFANLSDSDFTDTLGF